MDWELELQQLLTAWSATAGAERRLSGGHRSRVWAVRVAGKQHVARWSSRPEPALDWEIELLAHLRQAGMQVPEVLLATDGRPRVGALILFGWLEGHRPASEREWAMVAAELSRLHELTRDRKQRPGFLSSQELVVESAGGDVRLDLMPEDVVLRVREAWRALDDEPTSVVHGDVGTENIFVEEGSVGLIDWDEARVDASVFDLAPLPIELSRRLGEKRARLARRAAVAWEVANGWVAEPEYARRRLKELESLG